MRRSLVLAIGMSSPILFPCFDEFLLVGDLVPWGCSQTDGSRRSPMCADAGQLARPLAGSRNLDVIQQHFHGDLT